MMKIHLIAAARPNFMKIAPLYHKLIARPWARTIIVHTGQHYDINMSDAFFSDLMLPAPHIHLGIGSGTHAEQTGQVLMAYEKTLMQEHPDLVIVVGDVNSTLAATLAAVKMNIPVAHLEAGLRSYDRSMPEEINRIATDAMADILWTPSPDADENLLKEGKSPEKVVRVGNIMIDSLEMLRSAIESVRARDGYGLNAEEYGLVTLHRPANVDNPSQLGKLCAVLMEMSRDLPLVFPVHPRTRKNLAEYGLLPELEQARRIILTEPLSYKVFMSLLFDCKMAVTDSGGIQEETSYLGIPCFTLRPNTERPITLTAGTNHLCTIDDLFATIQGTLTGRTQKKVTIQLWDGKTSERVIQSIQNHFPEKTI